MIDNVFNLLFRCRHRRLTRPLKSITASGLSQGEAYVACLDCGMHFAYDTEQMRMGKRIAAELPGTPYTEPETRRWPRIAALITVPLGLIAAVVFRFRSK